MIRVLIKLKPLLLEKHRMTSGNQNEESKNNLEKDRDNYAKNSYGLKMLELFVKKYKI